MTVADSPDQKKLEKSERSQLQLATKLTRADLKKSGLTLEDFPVEILKRAQTRKAMGQLSNDDLPPLSYRIVYNELSKDQPTKFERSQVF
jgi:hypothetical protein